METSTLILGFILCIVVVVLVLQIVYVVYPRNCSTGSTDTTGSRNITEANPSSSVSTDIDVQHISGFNRVGDPFLYDGTYYVFRLGDVQLSSPTTNLKYSTLLTDGYISLNTTKQTKYPLSRSGIKLVYHDNNTLYVVVPVSYTHDWLNRGYITIKDDTYVLAVDTQAIATSVIQSGPVMRTPLALPASPSVPQVCRI